MVFNSVDSSYLPGHRIGRNTETFLRMYVSTRYMCLQQMCIISKQRLETRFSPRQVLVLLLVKQFQVIETPFSGRSESFTVRRCVESLSRRWPSKDFDDCPADCHVISSNWAFVKCCFRERAAVGVGSDFPPACLWSVFVSRFEATSPTCCDRKGINSASRQNKRKKALKGRWC